MGFFLVLFERSRKSSWSSLSIPGLLMNFSAEKVFMYHYFAPFRAIQLLYLSYTLCFLSPRSFITHIFDISLVRAMKCMLY